MLWPALRSSINIYPEYEPGFFRQLEIRFSCVLDHKWSGASAPRPDREGLTDNFLMPESFSKETIRHFFQALSISRPAIYFQWSELRLHARWIVSGALWIESGWKKQQTGQEIVIWSINRHLCGQFQSIEILSVSSAWKMPGRSRIIKTHVRSISAMKNPIGYKYYNIDNTIFLIYFSNLSNFKPLRGWIFLCRGG